MNNSVKSFKISDSETDNSIPYYDLSIAAGLFSEHQQVEKVRYIEIDGINYMNDYFACKVVGESMNKIIPNGSICLFKKYNGGTRNGLITLVEGNDIFDSDYGSQYTIKEYLSKKSIDNDEWQHQEIHLIPKSYDSSYKTIILQDDQLDNFKVIAEFIKVL
ncbi:helix-turn-helix transcriptional regulator [Chryseobacterium sp.]|uniref:S24 family peptidase n=1 Tax=Chryseobacterium sp. TaxID=1871047 RepID=UPI00388F1849